MKRSTVSATWRMCLCVVVVMLVVALTLGIQLTDLFLPTNALLQAQFECPVTGNCHAASYRASIWTCHVPPAAPHRDFHLKYLGVAVITNITTTAKDHADCIYRPSPSPSHTPHIPRVFHFAWCYGDTVFDFRRFLSMAAVIRLFRPDVVYLHYTDFPSLDRWAYHTWLEELQQQVAVLVTRQRSGLCEGAGDHPSPATVRQLLAESSGGYYISFDSIPINLLDRGSDSQCINITSPTDPHKTLLFATRVPVTSPEQCLPLSCLPYSETVTVDNFWRLPCVESPVSELYPRDIWPRTSAPDNQAHQLFRYIMYGQTQLPAPVKHQQKVVPNIAHYVWYGGGRMDFMFYLSVLSCLHVGGIDTVYIHGNKAPSGEWWQTLSIRDDVISVYHPYEPTVYGQTIHQIAHAADVTRGHVMLQYGGVLMDPDILMVRRLDPDLFHYDATLSLDNYVFAMLPFPNYLNLGIAMATPGAPFWRLYSDTQRQFINSDFVWNSGRVPYKLYERNPDLLHLDSRLQVICFKLKCHPTWVSNTRRGDALQLHTSLSEWRHQVFAFHWTNPSPAEFKSLVALRAACAHTTVTDVADMGRSVLRAAGLW